MDKEQKVSFSVKTILTVVFIIIGSAVGLYAIVRLAPILAILVISLLIVVALEPAIKRVMDFTVLNRKLSRSAAVTICYTLVLIVVAIILTVILPTVIEQSQKLISTLINIFSGLNLSGNDKDTVTLSEVLSQFSNISVGVLSAVFTSFRVLTTIFTILILSVYLSLDWENIKIKVSLLFPHEKEDIFIQTMEDIEVNISHWVKGQLILMLVVGFFSYIGLMIMDVNYALALGLLSGILEIVPMVGPILSAVVAGIIGFVDSPVKGFGVIVLFIIIQQLENNILVPKIMQKVSGFSPLIILLALMVGSELFGLVGAILAVPVTMVLVVILKKFLTEYNN